MSHFLWSRDKSVAVGTSTLVYGSTSDVFFTNETETTANPAFQVSGETAGTWRTLSNTEWNYLLNSRANATSLRAWVTLTDEKVSGLVILPDGSTVTASGVTTKDLVASSGAVFLPAAGSREGTAVSYVGSYCHYWSSTPDEGIGENAYSMRSTSGSMFTKIGSRDNGIAVRLVRDAR